MKIKRKLVAAIISVAVASVAGVAFALWTAQGSGSGSARAVTANSITVSAATGAADLYPGFAGGDVHFMLTNTNPYPVLFDSMTPGTITSSDPTGCPASNVTVASATGLSLAVPANGTSTAQSIVDVVTMASAAPDACQGVTFTVALTLTGLQA